jgi:hypothetical protein
VPFEILGATRHPSNARNLQTFVRAREMLRLPPHRQNIVAVSPLQYQKALRLQEALRRKGKSDVPCTGSHAQ